MRKFLCLSLVLVCVLCLSLPAFAAEMYNYNGFLLPYFSEYESIYDQYKYFMLVESEDGYHMYCFIDEPYATDYGIVSPSPQVVKIYALSEDGSSWVYVNFRSVGSGSSVIMNSNGDYRKWSTFDIYSRNGTLYYEGDLDFFPGPPLARVVEEGLSEMVLGLTRTIQTLVLCGVGLMASLVVLKLFGKRSLIYRG